MFFAAMGVNAQNVTVNPGGGSYPTLQAAFDAINAGTHTGNVTVSIVNSTTETASCVLNASGAGSASYTSVTINPTNDNVVVSGPTLTGRGLIELNGADNVTINGDNPNSGGTNRNLTIQNTADTLITFTSCIRTATSTLITNVDNNSIVNCILAGSGVGRNVLGNTAERVTWGIIVSGNASTVSATTAPSALTSATTTMASGQTAANLIISNNNIVTVSRGISINGAVTTVAPSLVISNNLIGNPTKGALNQVYIAGITVSGSDNVSITANTVYVESFHNTALKAIEVGVITTAINTANITNNIVGRVTNNAPTTYGAYGINLGGGNNHSVINNAVLNCTNDKTAGTSAFSTTFGVHGIRLGSGTGHKVYHNSVNLAGVIPGSISTDLVSCFTIVGTGQTGCDVRNNIFSNTTTGGNPTPYNDVFVCIYLPSGGTSAMNLTLNNNAYYQGNLAYSGIAQVSTTGNATNLYLSANFAPGVITPSTNLRAYTSTLSAAGTNDNASYAASTPAPFTSSTNLHIPFATAGPLESGGAFVGVTVDIDGQVRPGPAGSVNGGATAPDIGYDEFDGVPGGDITPPVISYTALTNTSSVSNRSFTNVTVTDVSGVNGTAGTRPRVYYKRSSDANTYVDNTSGTNGWKYAEASGATSPFSFTINYALLSGGGGVAVNNTVQYFVVAQDLAATPNVGINSGTFNANPTSVALTAGAFPLTGVINSYIISGPPLAGDYTIGVALFNSITGKNITFRKEVTTVRKEVNVPVNRDNNVTKSETASEYTSMNSDGEIVMQEVEEVAYVPYNNGERFTGELFASREEYPNLPLDAGVGVFATITDAVNSINLNGSSAAVRFLLLDASYTSETLPITINYATASAVNTLTIQPNTGVTSSISGAAANNAIFSILSSYVSIQGSNNNTVTRDLTITNTSTTTPSVVLIGSTGVTPITNVSLKNCIVVNGVNTSTAVVVSDAALPGTAGYFNNITIQNNRILKAYIGNYNIAVVSAGNGTGLNVTGNDLSTSGADAIRNTGVYVQGVDGGNVSNNIIANFETTTSEVDKGIWFATGTTNSEAKNNLIHDLIYTGSAGYGGKGISISTGLANANVSAVNNMIYNINGDGDSYTTFGSTYDPVGLYVYGTGQGGVYLYYNSIYLYGSNLNYSPLSYSIGIALDDGATATLKDNSIQNDLGKIGANGVGAVGIALESSAAQLILSNYNDIYCNASSGTNNPGKIGATDYPTLAGWQGITAQDANSLSANPLYVSTTDLHVMAGSPLINAGTPIAGITTDIDGQTRSVTTPTIGADEPVSTQTLSLKFNFESCPSAGAVTVQLRSSNSPYNLVQSVNSTAGGNVFNNVVFSSAVNGVGYYLVVKSANMVETWSAAPITFTAGSASYNFTTALNQAYGSNQKLSGGIVSVYQGDANQDGFVNSTDILAVYNNAIAFLNAPSTDFNCDGTTDVTDLILATNNSSSFVQVQKP